MGYQIESNEIKREDNSYVLRPSIDSLINIIDEKIINQKDNLKMDRSNYVHDNFSWKQVVDKLKIEFKKKLK